MFRTMSLFSRFVTMPVIALQPRTLIRLIFSVIVKYFGEKRSLSRLDNPYNPLILNNHIINFLLFSPFLIIFFSFQTLPNNFQLLLVVFQDDLTKTCIPHSLDVGVPEDI